MIEYIEEHMVGGKNVEKDVGNRKELCYVMSKVGGITKNASGNRWLG